MGPDQHVDHGADYPERTDYTHSETPKNAADLANTVTEMKHPLRIKNTTETHITFTCSRANDILHTHPGLFAVPEQSPTDRDTLVHGDLDVSCILSDPVPDRISENPVSMNCFDRELE